MPIRVFINGFGRIGRTTFALAHNDPAFEFVGINDLTDPKTLAHLLKHDSVHGHFPGTVEVAGDALVVNGKRIPVTALKDPEMLWAHTATLGIDIVYECTGKYRKTEQADGFIQKGGVKKVIVSAPISGAAPTLVIGVNHETYKPAEHHVMSNASCTTNCLAPVVHVLDQAFGFENGLMTTIHSYTNDQVILDAPHKDLRRARAAAVSMIPTTTGAAKAVGLVLPHLKGKLHGYAVRVPTFNVSVVDLTANLKRAVTKPELDAAMKSAAESSLKGILQYVDEELVSIDFNGSRYSSHYDVGASMVLGESGTLVKVVSWYDNEVGYSARMNDLARFVASKF